MNPVAFGTLIGITVFSGYSVDRFQRAMEKDLQKYLQGDHSVILVRAQLGFESLWGILPRVRILAHDFTCESLPFRVEKWRSRYGQVRRLHVEMDHFSLKGLDVDRLTADIPNVHFDLGYAMSQHHFRPSQSGTGPVTVTLKLADLQQFAAKKFPQLSEFTLMSDGNRLVASGKVDLAGLTLPFQLSGVPGVKDQAQLILNSPEFLVNGKPVDLTKSAGMFKGFSSLLDLNQDLGASGGIKMTSFLVKGDSLIGKGTVQIPDADPTGPGISH
jgi:hypothetical protein